MRKVSQDRPVRDFSLTLLAHQDHTHSGGGCIDNRASWKFRSNEEQFIAQRHNTIADETSKTGLCCWKETLSYAVDQPSHESPYVSVEEYRNLRCELLNLQQQKIALLASMNHEVGRDNSVFEVFHAIKVKDASSEGDVFGIGRNAILFVDRDSCFLRLDYPDLSI